MTSSEPEQSNEAFPVLPIAVGSGLGTALGIVFGNIAIGVAIGTGIGAAMSCMQMAAQQETNASDAE